MRILAILSQKSVHAYFLLWKANAQKIKEQESKKNNAIRILAILSQKSVHV
jgi:hypothetical protein